MPIGVFDSGLGGLTILQALTGALPRQDFVYLGDSANAPSIRLHAALGFARVALLPSVGFKLGRWVDVVIMQRPLGPGDATPPGSGATV